MDIHDIHLKSFTCDKSSVGVKITVTVPCENIYLRTHVDIFNMYTHLVSSSQENKCDKMHMWDMYVFTIYSCNSLIHCFGHQTIEPSVMSSNSTIGIL